MSIASTAASWPALAAMGSDWGLLNQYGRLYTTWEVRSRGSDINTLAGAQKVISKELYGMLGNGQYAVVVRNHAREVPAEALAPATSIGATERAVIRDARAALQPGADPAFAARTAKAMQAARWSIASDAVDMLVALDPPLSAAAAAVLASFPPITAPCTNAGMEDAVQVLPDASPNAAQQKTLAYLARKGAELVAHMIATRGRAHPITRGLLTWSRRVVPCRTLQQSSKGIIQSMAWRNCVLMDPDMLMSVPQTLNTLVHELTHLALGVPGHTPAFYKMYRQLLRVASAELGWTVEASCRSKCSLAPGETPQGVCPKCVWEDPPATCALEPTACEPTLDVVPRPQRPRGKITTTR